LAVAPLVLGDIALAADRIGGEGCERVAIASPCALDQVSPHGSPRVTGRPGR
jgi:hypothetical protein